MNSAFGSAALGDGSWSLTMLARRIQVPRAVRRATLANAVRTSPGEDEQRPFQSLLLERKHMSTPVVWTSRTGQTLRFQVCRFEGAWLEVPGVYLFCRRDSSGQYQPVYVGQTECFRTRFANHHKWPAASRAGAAFVLACRVSDSRLRLALERELIARFNPELNEVLNSAAAIARILGTTHQGRSYQ